MTIFDQMVQHTLEELNEAPVQETIKKIISEKFPAEKTREAQWISKITNEIDGFGPIAEFLRDPEVTEICINGFDMIFIERAGCLFKAPVQFVSPLTYDRFIKHLFLLIEKAGDRRHPLVDGMLEETRVHVALPPVTTHPTVSLRKKSDRTWRLEELQAKGMMAEALKDKFRMWVDQRKNILVCGPTSSGKTTLLRAFLAQCPDTERIVSIEDTRELTSIGSHHVNLLSRSDPEGLVPPIDLSMLLRNVLRMRPDRIVVGEVRGEEAVVLLDALATGHRGSFSTIHAHCASHALKRLESLVSRACPRWDLQAIRQLIFDSIDAIVVCDKKNGLRKITQTALLSGIESFGYLLDSENH